MVLSHREKGGSSSSETEMPLSAKRPRSKQQLAPKIYRCGRRLFLSTWVMYLNNGEFPSPINYHLPLSTKDRSTRRMWCVRYFLFRTKKTFIDNINLFSPKAISISIAIGLLSQSNLHYDWLLDTSDRYTPVIQLRGTLWMYHADNIKSILGLVYWTFSYGIVILLGITALGGSFIGGKWDWVKSLQNIKHLPNCAFSIWYTRFQNCCIMIYCHAAISKQIDKHLLWAYRFAGIVFGSQMYLSGSSFH